MQRDEKTERHSDGSKICRQMIERRNEEKQETKNGKKT